MQSMNQSIIYLVLCATIESRCYIEFSLLQNTV